MNILQVQYYSTNDKHSFYDTLEALLVKGSATGVRTDNHLIINMGIILPSLELPVYNMIYAFFTHAADLGFNTVQFVRNGSTTAERINPN